MDTLNKFLVGGSLSGDIVIMRPPHKLSREDALNLGVTLVVIAGYSPDEVAKAMLELMAT